MSRVRLQVKYPASNCFNPRTGLSLIYTVSVVSATIRKFIGTAAKIPEFEANREICAGGMKVFESVCPILIHRLMHV